MKKFLSLLLCASMLFAFAVPAVQNNEDYGISTCGIFGDEDEIYNGTSNK